MSMVTKYLYIAVAVAVAALAMGFATSPLSALTPLPVLLGLLALIGRRQTWRWSASLTMVGCVTLSALGVLRAAHPVWMLLAVIAALAAWDLDHFALRIESAQRIRDEIRFRDAHIRRLGWVLGLGFVLSLLALSLQLQLDLGWAIALGLLAVVSLGQAIQLLKRESG